MEEVLNEVFFSYSCYVNAESLAAMMNEKNRVIFDLNSSNLAIIVRDSWAARG